MAKTFKRGDHVEWNSEAGIVSGVIFKERLFQTCDSRDTCTMRRKKNPNT